MYAGTVRQMRGMDRRAVDGQGIADDSLMENAGRADYCAMLRQTGVRAGRPGRVRRCHVFDVKRGFLHRGTTSLAGYAGVHAHDQPRRRRALPT